jgi:porin
VVKRREQHAPRPGTFSDLSSSDWTNTFEVGLVAEDLLGLGPGIYRAIPFVATVDGATGAGVLLNLEQRLGRDGPLGAFVRAGLGNSSITSLGGTEAIVSGGLVVEATAGTSFLREQRAFLALGAYWLDSALEGTPNAHEWGFEVTYVLPLTPTLTLQPDLQVILDPVFNAEHDASVALTLQLNMLW